MGRVEPPTRARIVVEVAMALLACGLDRAYPVLEGAPFTRQIGGGAFAHHPMLIVGLAVLAAALGRRPWRQRRVP
jgi:hypothetical protein